MARWLFKCLALLLGLGLLLGGVIALGPLAQDRLRSSGRYAAAFADVGCEPPPGLTRGAFLDEVQYLAGLPDRLSLLDTELPRRLADAFARHPWVERVERVAVTPPRQVRVELTYRRAVLAVRSQGKLRA